MIRFGAWSTLLGLGVLFGLAVALALATRRVNVAANRLLAALLAAIALEIVPYAIGFAGFYDAYPGLSFAPLEWTLAFGPLLWLHVVALTEGRLPPGGWRHGMPALGYAAYLVVVFIQPQAAKDAWNDRIHEPFVDPAATAAGLASLAIYLAAAWRRYRRYQRWLDAHVSNREDHRLSGLRNVLLAMAVLLAASLACDAATFVLRLDYFARFPLYAGLTVLVYLLGLEGWRQADRAHPVPEVSPPTAAPAAARDWRVQGEAWLAQTVRADWWRDPELSLDKLARHLGTNTTYLSRALNEGLGLGFAEVIARQRVAWVQQELTARPDGGDLLSLAFEAGFSSKTSFNRVFKAQTGQTPSQFRAAARARS